MFACGEECPGGMYEVIWEHGNPSVEAVPGFIRCFLKILFIVVANS